MAKSNKAWLRRHVSEAPKRLSEVTRGAPWATAELEVLIGGALAKRPADRFPDAAAMTAALDAAFLSLDRAG